MSPIVAAVKARREGRTPPPKGGGEQLVQQGGEQEVMADGKPRFDIKEAA